MRHFYERLIWAMQCADLDPSKDQSRLARLVGEGCKPQNIQHLLDPNKNAKSSKYTPRIAKVLGCDADWLAYGTGRAPTARAGHSRTEDDVDEAPPLRSGKLIPVVGEVMSGLEGFLEEFEYPVGHGEGYVDYPSGDTNAYALRVRGDSMHPRYRAGEFVIIEPNIEPLEGDDVVVICKSGRKLLKQLNWRRHGEIQLLSINNGYNPLTLSADEVVSIHLVAGSVRRSAFRPG